MDRLVLVDGHAILHRAYHAYPPLTTSKGELINAVYGFTSILLSVLKELDPEYVAVAFDLPKPTFRHKEFKPYKAHRPKVDEELKEQIPKAKTVVKTLNIPIFEKEGFEADDVIGSLALQANLNRKTKNSKLKTMPTQKSSMLGKAGANQNLKLSKTVKPSNSEALEAIIVTGDRDALQLLNKNTKVYVPGRGKRPPKMYGEKEFVREYGFKPKQLIDYKALCGDASDAIPGVSGIGPKTATSLIKQHGSIEGIYRRLGVKSASSTLQCCKESIRRKLLAGAESAKLSKKLATIVTDVPLKLELRKCRLMDYDSSKAVQLFEELEFRSLIGRLPGMEGKTDRKKARLRAQRKTEDTESKQMGLF